MPDLSWNAYLKMANTAIAGLGRLAKKAASSAPKRAARKPPARTATTRTRRTTATRSRRRNTQPAIQLARTGTGG